jgi:hypothetical protein
MPAELADRSSAEHLEGGSVPLPPWSSLTCSFRSHYRVEADDKAARLANTKQLRFVPAAVISEP